MGTTNWSTSLSSLADNFDDLRVYHHVNEDGDPINPADVDADPVVQLRKVTRVEIRIKLTPDASSPFDDDRPAKRTYRLAAAAAGDGSYGDESGSGPDNPAPITTGIAADLTALRQVMARMKLQARLDINGDVET